MSRYQPHFPYRSTFDIRTALKSLDEDYQASQRLDEDMQRMAVQLRAAKAAGLPLVYAVLRREAPLVKVGFSRNLSGPTGRLQRMRGCDLVAVQPGGRDVERSIHDRLAGSRVTADLPGYGMTEHFRISDEVMEWINEARAAIGLEPMTKAYLLSR